MNYSKKSERFLTIRISCLKNDLKPSLRPVYANGSPEFKRSSPVHSETTNVKENQVFKTRSSTRHVKELQPIPDILLAEDHSESYMT